MTTIRIIGFTCFFLIILPAIGFAIEPGDIKCDDPGTFCAASCSVSDIQTAANNAMASGLADTTIYIPACSLNPYPWAAGKKLVLKTDPSKVIRVIGSGRDTTQIAHFQIDVPSSTKLNLVEFGHIGCDGNADVGSMLDYRLRPETLNRELYWHDFSVKGYTAGYTLTFEGWHGVVSNVDMTCKDNGASQNAYGIAIHGDGVYSDHSVDFGTRNAFFIEDSTFDSCSHTVSSFCDGFVVFRNNVVRNADSHTDLHGPGYNYCYYNPDEKTAGGGMELYDNHFYQSQGKWIINARAGKGHIYTNNRFDDPEYKIVLYWDKGSSTHGNNCGTGAGQTCGRCDTIGCEGCCQAQEKTYIWDNDGAIMEYSGGSAGDCLIEDATYFLRQPSLAEDGFEYTRFTYPHPLAAGKTDPELQPDPETKWITPKSVHSGNDTKWTNYLIDNNVNTKWTPSVWKTQEYWVVLDLGASTDVTGVRVLHEREYDKDSAITAIHVSDDAQNWSESLGRLPNMYREAPGWKKVEFKSARCRYIKLVTEITNCPYWREVEIRRSY